MSSCFIILSLQDLNIILDHLSSVIMNYLCEILLKIVQNFFLCVPDGCARNLVKVAK